MTKPIRQELTSHDLREIVAVQRLPQEIKTAFLQNRCSASVAAPGHCDHRRQGLIRRRLTEDLEAVALRHHEIGHDQAEALRLEPIRCHRH